MNKTEKRRGELKEALIEAAERAVVTIGPEGIRAREIAREVGCAVGAIYNVFPDLDAIYFAVNSRTLAAFEEFVAGRRRKTMRKSDTRQQAIGALVDLALAYFDFAAENQPRWRTLFEHRLAAPGRDLPEWYVDEQRRLFLLVEEPLGALRPDMTGDERMLFARTMFSAVHGVVSLGLDEKVVATPHPVLRQQIATLVGSIGDGLLRAAGAEATAPRSRSVR